ncbi:hypothetical protein PDIDSM_2801 [Penicillium digitatum]|nr:hypothetical protein PDIDSM_2801 [Penicillium digitatum]
MAPIIQVIGCLNADRVLATPRFPDPGETITSSSYFTSAGGKGANQAVVCGRMSRAKQTGTKISKSDVVFEMIGAVGVLDGHFSALIKSTRPESKSSRTHTRVWLRLSAKSVWYSAADGGSSGPSDRVLHFTYDIAAAPVSRVLDTTAAGDTFVGAYTVRVARWREQRRAQGKAEQDVADNEKAYWHKTIMDEEMHLAACASAQAVERQGAMDIIPFDDEI